MAAARPARPAGGVRLRTTLVATVVVGAAMAVGAIVLVVLLRDTLTREVRTGGELRAAELAVVLASGVRPGAVPLNDADGQWVQVTGPGGLVVAASTEVRGLALLARPQPGFPVETTTPVDEGRSVVVARDAAGTTFTVVVGRSLDTVDEAIATASGLLVVGLPALLAVVALTTWVVVGRSLRPVEAIRREVHEISAADLYRRVPNPGGDDEITRLARTMNGMLARLEQAQARQRRFVSDASHELRSPVAAIRQHAEVEIAHPGLTASEELAATVLAEDLRIERLVEDLLLLARADEHALARHRGPVDLDDVVRAEARRLRATGTGLRVDTSPVGTGQVEGDAAGLGRALRNLVDNAARHARSAVTFELHESGGGVLLAVDDDGAGIPERDRQRVLERFVRLDAARARDSGGSGLGLAIVTEWIAVHHGTVRIASSSLGGARVEIWLPTSAAPAD